MELTIFIGDETFEITGTFDPGEQMVHTYANGDPGHPGSPPEFEIELIMWNDCDATNLIYELGKMEKFETLCLENINND